MTGHKGYVGILYSNLDVYIGSNALVMRRLSGPKKRPLYESFYGVIGRAPEGNYCVSENPTDLMSHTIGSDDLVFVKR